MTFKFTPHFLKVTSTPSVENLRICMTEKYQVEDISTARERWSEEKSVFSSGEKTCYHKHYKGVPAREEP